MIFQGESSYPVYHSVHDNFYWASTFGDPNFTHHKAMGEMWSRIGIEIATTPILPYNPTDYTQRLREMYDDLKEMYEDSLKQHGISLGMVLHVYLHVVLYVHTYTYLHIYVHKCTYIPAALVKLAQRCLVCAPLGIHLEPINKHLILLVII